MVVISENRLRSQKRCFPFSAWWNLKNGNMVKFEEMFQDHCNAFLMRFQFSNCLLIFLPFSANKVTNVNDSPSKFFPVWYTKTQYWRLEGNAFTKSLTESQGGSHQALKNPGYWSSPLFPDLSVCVRWYSLGLPLFHENWVYWTG